MSTRAVYTFKDNHETIHVYKHCDGYPEGGLSWIANARHFAWNLPRFEASDFAAAFVAANKEDRRKSDYPNTCGGDVRLTSATDPWDVAGDAEYHYTVTCVGGELMVRIDAVSWWKGYSTPETLFDGTLADAITEFTPRWVEAA